jgi:hypothetical protein
MAFSNAIPILKDFRTYGAIKPHRIRTATILGEREIEKFHKEQATWSEKSRCSDGF